MSAVSLKFILLLAFRKSLCLTGVCRTAQNAVSTFLIWKALMQITLLCFSCMCRFEVYCCAHFEKRGNECKECEFGFDSNGNDDPCKECPPGLFGFRCTETCNCKISSCDHVYGCSDRRTVITTQTSHQDTEANADTNFPDIITTNRNDTNANADTNFPDIITTNRNVDRVVIGTSSVPDMDAISTREMLIYCIAVAFILFVMVFCFVFHKYSLNLQKKHLEIVKLKGDLKVADSAKPLHCSEETQDLYHYHVIDETKMCDMVSVKKLETPNLPLKVIRSSSESGSSEDHNENPNEYLHPYNALLQKSETHEYKRVAAVHDDITEATSSGSNMSLPDTDKQGYLHMYQPLKPPKKHSGQQFVVTASVSRADESSSDSEQDLNKGYSNTYQPLRQEDIQCHAYEKPFIAALTVFDALFTNIKSKSKAESSCSLQDERKRNGQLGIDGIKDLSTTVGTPSNADRVKTL